MAFDQSTRNRLARFVGETRFLLSEEFTRQLQNEYGMDPESGAVTELEKLTALDDSRRETARILRETLEYYLAGKADDRKNRQETLQRIVREQAFTVLNRLCALRMAESRGILIESIAQGYQSKGFLLYARLAGAGLGETGDAYRTYLFSLFDEFAVDLAALFDRFNPQGRLFPRETALLKVTALINDPEIDPLWAEDETIGWIYQYFNSKEERKAMRDASQAPRNSRELAVRNQFFTPRYVVEFLTDNTLGRIWYEMTKGTTALQDACQYLVRRPNEIFLNEGAEAPAQASDEALSQEELLRQPAYIPHRPLKDPREIKMLDPACGSMHFGLYAFDLFEQIYAEAWDLEESLGEDALWRLADLDSLQKTYPNRAAFLRDVPRLIIERNIHGVDIDPRAVQIAGLSLWLRAQKSWQAQDVKTGERPQIRRSNIVCAEPMPGDRDMLEEFLGTLKEDRLEALMRQAMHVPAGGKVRATKAMAAALGKLVRTIWQEMELAGEAGSLLKIEETLREAIAEARKESEEKSPLFQAIEFGADAGAEKLGFWDQAETLTLIALQNYAEQAAEGQSYRRRLFVEDAANGFAFIDLSSKKYDVILMNPPFGESTDELKTYCDNKFDNWSSNILCAFILRGWTVLLPSGFLGCIFDRTAVVKSSYENFRKQFVLSKARIQCAADTGWNVLDANVETYVFTLGSPIISEETPFFDLRQFSSDDKESELQDCIRLLREGFHHLNTYLANVETFTSLPNSIIGYDLPYFLIHSLSLRGNLEGNGVVSYQGHALEASVHYRLWWEIDSDPADNTSWVYAFKGGEYSPYYLPNVDVAYYGLEGNLVPKKTSNVLRNIKKQGLSGIAFGKRGDYLDAQPLAKEQIFTHEGHAFAGVEEKYRWILLALLNSRIFSYGINSYCGQHKTSGYVNLFPFFGLVDADLVQMGKFASEIWSEKKIWYSGEETDPNFIASYLVLGMLDDIKDIDQVLETLFEKISKKTAHIQLLDRKIEELLIYKYSVPEKEVEFMIQQTISRPQLLLWQDRGELDQSQFSKEITFNFCSYLLGMIFGRWDVTAANSETTNKIVSNPFEKISFKTPGMLHSKTLDVDYPLNVERNGILAVDLNNPSDLNMRLHKALHVFFGNNYESAEQRISQILEITTMSRLYSDPMLFFAKHLTHYSKSHRQAPIYWQLSTPSNSYSLWLYYHRLNDQTLFTCVNDFVDPKIKQVSEEAKSLRVKKSRSSSEERELELLTDFERELKDFRDELLRVAKFWKPNLNDGVQITAAPLWKVFQHRPWQKKLKETWESLEAGEYDWSHLAYSIWTDRVREKCKTDKSLAIAHDLEHLYVESVQPAKKNRKSKIVPPELFEEE